MLSKEELDQAQHYLAHNHKWYRWAVSVWALLLILFHVTESPIYEEWWISGFLLSWWSGP